MDNRIFAAHVSRAAGRALYTPEEERDLVEDPLSAIEKRTGTLEISPQSITTFLEMIDGLPTDLGPLMDLGNQLWKIVPPEAIDSARRDGVELKFEEEQLLLLASHLLEDAFFRGDLLALEGKNAAIGLFIANRIAKVVERMPYAVREEFVWTKEQWDSLYARVRDFATEQISETVVAAKMAPLQAERVRLEEEVRATESPVARKLRDVEERLVVVRARISDTKGAEIEKRYVVGLKQRVQDALLAFDKHFPKGFSGYLAVKDLLKEIYAGLRTPEFLRDFLRSEECIGRVAHRLASTEKASPYNMWGARVAYEDIEREERAAAKKDADMLKAAAIAAKMHPVLHDAFEELSNGPSGEIAEFIALQKELRLLAPRREELFHQLNTSPSVNPALRRQLDEVDQELGTLRDLQTYRWDILRAIDDSALQILDQVSRFDAFPERVNLAPEGVRELYFLKSYLVAADMRRREGFRPELSVPLHGQEILDHQFSIGREGGIAKAHYNVRDMSFAKWIVEYQLAKRVAKKSVPSIVLGSKRVEREQKEAKHRQERIATARDVYGEFMDLKDRQKACKTILLTCDALERSSDGLSRSDLEDIEHQRIATEAREENAVKDLEILTSEHEQAFEDITQGAYVDDSYIADRIVENFPDLQRSEWGTMDFQEWMPVMKPIQYEDFLDALPRLESLWEENPVIMQSFFRTHIRYQRLWECVEGLRDILDTARSTGAGEENIRELEDEFAFMHRLLVADRNRVAEFVAENPTLFPEGAFAADGKMYHDFFQEIRRHQNVGISW